MKKTFSVQADWLIDGTGEQIHRDVVLFISNGLIKSIKNVKPDTQKGAEMIDLSGFTLLPGLVDSHVHLFMSGTNNPEDRQRQIDAPYREVKEVIQGHLLAHLQQGVVALRDGGDYAGHTLRYKKADLNLSEIPVRVGAAGRAWHAPGHYGRLIGQAPLDGHTLAQSILKQHEWVDHIKIVNSGLNSLTHFGRETTPQFSPEVLREAVKTGNTLGLKTMVHANGKDAVRAALEAGCHSIEHGFFMGRENMKRMAEKGVLWVPTACTMAAYARMLPPGSLEADTAKRNLDHQLDQIRLAADLGVSLAVGTDAGSLGVHHGHSVKEEVGLFILAGFSTEKAVQCATSTGAALLGLERETGMLSPGMPATFLAVRGSPEKLLGALETPEWIFISGREWVGKG